MELLLNLLWVALAAVAFSKVWRDGRVPTSRPRPSTATALLAVGCILCLLFPIVSASDDLHGDQALAEDAIKRVSHTVGTLHQVKHSTNTWLFLCVLSLLSLLSLVRLSLWHSLAISADPMYGRRPVVSGRAPPLLG